MCHFFPSWDSFLYLAAKWFDVDDKDEEEEPASQGDWCEKQCTTSDSDDEDVSDEEKDLNCQLKWLSSFGGDLEDLLELLLDAVIWLIWLKIV